MKTESHHKKSSDLIITIVRGIFIGLLLFVIIVIINNTYRPLWLITGKLTDNKSYLVYIPDGLAQGKKYPLVFALSPGADAILMISTWSSIAEKHKWIVAASKEFHNGQEFRPALAQLEADLSDVEKRYPIDTARVIFTGISGGGMGAHAFSKFYPRRVSAIVINTGMIDASFMTRDYPREKLVVFLASPTDFRFNEMKRDRIFLALRQWKTKWIEFSGGHTMAPASIYEQAAEWLEENLL